MQKFTTQLRVRHYEMDALGHVNNAVYQHYLEQAGIEHTEDMGFTVDRYRELGGVFVMRRLEIDYLRPAVAGDTLEITTWLQEIRGSRAIRRYELRILGKEDLVVKAEATWVWVNLATMRPKAIPPVMLEAFLATKPPSLTESVKAIDKGE
ncbi:acyl-CoA thioesterase [Planktothrix sp. FACHB-1355]|uniref:Acyl-CoA thioesterase n=1 Tax=Aerosakkonema funiforme FACHB-1375 TaxID=2949571 RepID=A0A926ZI19_9CYAN|nr:MULTISPECIES: thioesterase family protein [Oscillatoriales]MBD2181341.1 acyl-CoA thioesterase [Aerosakkonema funiforme FACHB-1375]MBD3557563.1 acyl-CoA thioesterase [Planktothrix sp. FACHB-1355]